MEQTNLTKTINHKFACKLIRRKLWSYLKYPYLGCLLVHQEAGHQQTYKAPCDQSVLSHRLKVAMRRDAVETQTEILHIAASHDCLLNL